MHCIRSHGYHTLCAARVPQQLAVFRRNKPYVGTRPNGSYKSVIVDVLFASYATLYPVFFFSSYSFLNHHVHCPAQIVRGFTLSDLLDKPWSQVSSLLTPPVHAFTLIAQKVQHSHFSAFCARRFRRFLPTYALALSARRLLRKKKSLRARECTRRDLNP